MIEIVNVNGKVETIDMDAPKEEQKAQRQRIAKERRRAAAKAKRRNMILYAQAMIAAILLMAAAATPLEPGFHPEYAGGLVIVAIICGGWLALFGYANSEAYRRRREAKKELEMIQGNPMLREAQKEMSARHGAQIKS